MHFLQGRGHLLIGVAIALAMVGLLFIVGQRSPSRPPPDTREVLRQATVLRALGIEEPAQVARQLSAMPSGALDLGEEHEQHRLRIWSTFFRGTLIKLARTASSRPLVVYYNPLHDVALVQSCRLGANAGERMDCNTLCAVPGEVLSDDAIERPVPSWIGAQNPLGALVRQSSQRMAAFEREHPADEDGVIQWHKEHCSERNQSVAELRIMQAAATLSRLSPIAFKHAVANYVTGVVPWRSAGSVQANDALPVLLNANQFSLAGAVPIGADGWLVFLTAKKTGWRTAALVLSGHDYLSVKGAVLLRLKS